MGIEALPKKKRKQGRSNSADERPPRVARRHKKLAQYEWRLNCLDQRAHTGRLTEKNLKELQTLETLLPA